MTPCDAYGETQFYKTQHFERCLQGECGGFRDDLKALHFDVQFYKLHKQQHPNFLPHPIGTAPQELYAAAGDALHVCSVADTALNHSICADHQSVLQHGITNDMYNAAMSNAAALLTSQCCINPWV